MDLPCREQEAKRIAERINGYVNLGAQPATRAADRLFESPPFAPAAC